MTKHGVKESSSPGGGNQQQKQRRQLQIRGHRPSPLSIHKDSHMIKKPPTLTQRQPVVVSPKVVHTTLSDFRSVVHRLTGVNNSVSQLQFSASSASTDYEVIVIYRRGDITNDAFVKVVQRLTGIPNSVSDLNNSVSVPLNSYVVKGSSKDLQDTELSTSAIREYDAVIRYMRGCISKGDFISHLHAALSRRGVSVREDIDEVDTVPECRVLIIFLTSTYVPSNLLNIVEQQSKKPRVVYPIFYGISPSDLITNSEYYESFFLQDEPKRWQAALEKISQMHGYILTDKYVMPVIVKRFLMKVFSAPSNLMAFHFPMITDLVIICFCSIFKLYDCGYMFFALFFFFFLILWLWLYICSLLYFMLSFIL